MKTVVLINGPKRGGKDYTAAMLINKLADIVPTRALSFAYPLKKIMADTFGLSTDTLDKYKNDKLRILTEDSSGFQEDLSDFRTLLQRFGTEGCKPQFGEAVWANLLLSKILDNEEEEIILVPDFRFNIEGDIIKSSSYNVIALKVRNDDMVTEDAHASERELDDYDFDFVIDNTGYSDKLCQRIEKFIKDANLIP